MPGGVGSGDNENVPYVWTFVCTKRGADASVDDSASDIADANYVALQPGQNGSQGSQNRLRQCPEPDHVLRFMKSPAAIHEWKAADLGGRLDGLGARFEDGFSTVIGFFVVGLVGAAVLRFLRANWRL